MTRFSRGQSHVVGVALLLGVTVISISAITASVGVLVDRQVASADATRVADGMDAFDPRETTGVRRDRLTFADGTLGPADRQLRILDGARVVRSVDADALVFTSGDQRVAFVAGAITRGPPGEAWLHAEPTVTVPTNESVLVVGVPTIGSPDAVSGSGGVTATVERNASHERSLIGNGSYAVAIETATPGPLARHFSEQGAAVERRDLDGDGVESVVATFEGRRRTYLVVHDLDVEVT